MKFTDLLKDDKNVEDTSEDKATNSKNEVLEESEKKEPQEVLRGAGFKIKMITPTAFGTQIDFAKRYDADDIKDILSDYTIKIKDKSVFIIN